MATVRPLAAHEWALYRDVRLAALRDSPDAFGSTVEREVTRPDSEWAERVESGVASDLDLPLVIAEAEDFVGLAWGRIDPAPPATAHVFQMWVAPEHRGLGHGDTLLSSLVDWAEGWGARRVLLAATLGNTAAQKLYSQAGFVAFGSPEPLRPGASLQSQTMLLELAGSNVSSIRVLVICVFRHDRSILVARGVDEVKGKAFLRPVGGAVEFGESSVEALRREVREELGAEITDPVRLGVLENRFTYSGKPGHEIVFVYDAEFKDPDLYARAELPLNEPIWDGAARWVDLESLPDEPIYPDGLVQLLDSV